MGFKCSEHRAELEFQVRDIRQIEENFQSELKPIEYSRLIAFQISIFRIENADVFAPYISRQQTQWEIFAQFAEA